jgi:hypothetical protein
MPILVHADGTTETSAYACTSLIEHNGKFFRLAGVALREYGERDHGCAVYIEIPEPDLAPVRAFRA